MGKGFYIDTSPNHYLPQKRAGEVYISDLEKRKNLIISS